MTRIEKSLMVAALPILALGVAPGAAMAQSYSGSWSLNITLPPQFTHTGCLTLVDTGTGGQHSGSATLSGQLAGNDGPQTGTFQVANHVLVATFQNGSDTGEVTYSLFIARASNGDLEPGIYEAPGFLSGALTFGARGGC